MGIDKYNAACRGIVNRYCSEWEVIVGVSACMRIALGCAENGTVACSPCISKPCTAAPVRCLCLAAHGPLDRL